MVVTIVMLSHFSIISQVALPQNQKPQISSVQAPNGTKRPLYMEPPSKKARLTGGDWWMVIWEPTRMVQLHNSFWVAYDDENGLFMFFWYFMQVWFSATHHGDIEKILRNNVVTLLISSLNWQCLKTFHGSISEYQNVIWVSLKIGNRMPVIGQQ